MASEKLSYEIAAIYSASPEVKRAIDDFAKINTTGAKVRQQLNSLQTVSGKTGEQFRKTRVNTAQLGIQINQLGTQIASGTNVGMAFTQQIGDIGFAMSNAGGKLGMFGRMLSGPVGFALGGLMMALGPAVSEMLGLGDAAEDAEGKFEDLDRTFNILGMTTSELTELNEALADSNRNVGESAFYSATQARMAAQANMAQARSVIAGARAEIARLQGAATDPRFFDEADNLNAAAERLNGRIAAANVTLGEAEVRFRTANAEVRALTFGLDEQGREALQVQSDIDMMTAAYIRFGDESILDTIDEFRARHENLTEATESGARATEDYADGLNALKDQFTAILPTLNLYEQALSDVLGVNIEPAGMEEAGLGMIERAFDSGAISRRVYTQLRDGIREAVPQIQSAIEIEGAVLGETMGDMIKVPAGALESLVDRSVTAASVIASSFKKNFDAIGQSVAQAFQGMLTGAQSWRDGVRSIIQSVINQLWQMYIVQQITGFLTSALGSIGLPGAGSGGGAGYNTFGGGIKAFASGGFARGGEMAIVGEKGPELFIPQTSGTVIPNHQIGGGGATINVSVDARGASDPAMVREQAQRAVLEAAPAIVAAAEKRTVNRLQRPRLGGAIQ